MIGLAQIRAWNAGELDAIGSELNTLADRLVSLQDELNGSAQTPGWTGGASEAAARAQRDLAQRLQVFVAAAASVHKALTDAADRVEDIQRQLRAAEAIAAANQFAIADDGTVTDLAPPGTVIFAAEREAANAREAIKNDLERRLRDIITQAQQTDTALAGVMAAAQRGDVWTGPTAPGDLAGARLAGEVSGATPDPSLDPLTPGLPTGTPGQTTPNWWNQLGLAGENAVLTGGEEFLGEPIRNLGNLVGLVSDDGGNYLKDYADVADLSTEAERVRLYDEARGVDTTGLHYIYVPAVGATGALTPAARQHIQESKLGTSWRGDQPYYRHQPSVVTYDPGGKTGRRGDALRGIPTAPPDERDEYPMAINAEGGDGSSVKYIPQYDNRSSGSLIGRQIAAAHLKPGDRIVLVTE